MVFGSIVGSDTMVCFGMAPHNKRASHSQHSLEVHIPCTCIFTTVSTSHPPGPILLARYLHSSWNSVDAAKLGVGNVSPRAFRRHIVRCWHWHPLACREIELGKPPQGQGVIHTVVYTTLALNIMTISTLT